VQVELLLNNDDCPDPMIKSRKYTNYK
jgi:hypothetical protein